MVLEPRRHVRMFIQHSILISWTTSAFNPLQDADSMHGPFARIYKLPTSSLVLPLSKANHTPCITMNKTMAHSSTCSSSAIQKGIGIPLGPTPRSEARVHVQRFLPGWGYINSSILFLLLSNPPLHFSRTKKISVRLWCFVFEILELQGHVPSFELLSET